MSQFKYENTAELVEDLKLLKHIEGGYFRETYRNTETVETPRGKRNKETVIYYCLPSSDFSVWHKLIDLEETFHFHYGQDTILYIIQDGAIVTKTLSDTSSGEMEITIPPNVWFAIRPSGTNIPTDYSLMSCHVVPGFDYSDLVIADEGLLEELKPEFHKLARSLLKKY